MASHQKALLPFLRSIMYASSTQYGNLSPNLCVVFATLDFTFDKIWVCFFKVCGTHQTKAGYSPVSLSLSLSLSLPHTHTHEFGNLY